MKDTPNIHTTGFVQFEFKASAKVTSRQDKINKFFIPLLLLLLLFSFSVRPTVLVTNQKASSKCRKRRLFSVWG